MPSYHIFCWNCKHFTDKLSRIPYLYTCPICGATAKPAYRKEIRKLSHLPAIIYVYKGTQAYNKLKELEKQEKSK